MSDEELDDNTHPFLTTRRWVKDRWAEWFNGSPENSPLWQSRVLGEFPSASSNALIPLALLEAACRPAIDHGEQVIIGVDPAGPGRDRTVAVACAGGAILDVGVFTDANAEGPTIQFIRKWRDRVKIVRVDSAGIGFYFSEHMRGSGYPHRRHQRRLFVGRQRKVCEFESRTVLVFARALCQKGQISRACPTTCSPSWRRSSTS